MGRTAKQAQAIDLVRQYYRAVNANDTSILSRILSPEVTYQGNLKETLIGQDVVLYGIQVNDTRRLMPTVLNASQSGRQVASRHDVMARASVGVHLRSQGNVQAFFELKGGMIVGINEYHRNAPSGAGQTSACPAGTRDRAARRDQAP